MISSMSILNLILNVKFCRALGFLGLTLRARFLWAVIRRIFEVRVVLRGAVFWVLKLHLRRADVVRRFTDGERKVTPRKPEARDKLTLTIDLRIENVKIRTILLFCSIYISHGLYNDAFQVHDPQFNCQCQIEVRVVFREMTSKGWY